MARIDAPGAASEGLSPRGSQSRLSAAIFFVLLAALLFRLVTAVAHRDDGKADDRASELPPLVRWTPIEKASMAAAASGKPVLYDFTAAWCVPCHRLDDEGWGDREMAGLANDGYVPARVVDREREEGRNRPLVAELQHRYAVQAFPTLIVAAPDGREIARFEGWGGRDGLRRFLEDSKSKK